MFKKGLIKLLRNIFISFFVLNIFIIIIFQFNKYKTPNITQKMIDWLMAC